jgi:hypothetical protein
MQVGEIVQDKRVISTTPAAASESSLTWTIWHHKREPRKVCTVILALGITALGAFFVFHNIIVSLVAMALVFGAVADKLLPLTYQLEPEHVTVKLGKIEWLEMAWNDVKSVYETSDGIKLSVFSTPKLARLEHVRGILLLFPDSKREEIAKYIQQVRASQ